MRILVMYYSRTGSTQALAEAVARGVESVQGVSCALKPVDQVTKEDFVESAGIVAGSPVYFGGMAAEMKEVFDKFVGVRRKMADKVGAAFATSGDPTGGKETTLFSILQAMLIYGMIVVGDPLDATGHYGVACCGAPDKRTQSHAQALGKRVATLARMLSGASSM
ncbi:NAD(P)H-dependent oxidoreductase [Candidatus Sumerlaeota bacterium]|nr:NAD(P)H-dependent oxidoreductase [Candidatus Sumerlaeota bacterium]